MASAVLDLLCQLETFRSLTKPAQQFYTLEYRGPTIGRLVTWMVQKGNEKDRLASVLQRAPGFAFSLDVVSGLLVQTLASASDSSAFRCSVFRSLSQTLQISVADPLAS